MNQPFFIIMKIILFSLALVLILFIVNNLSEPSKLVQCEIGREELFKFSLQNKNVPLIKAEQLHQHVNFLISNEPQFKDVHFITTQEINDSQNREALLFNHGQCIKFLRNENQDILAIAFISQNYRMEWSDVEILMKVIEPFNTKELWYNSDIYKIAVNLYDGYISYSDNHHFYYQYHYNSTNGLFFVNKNNKKLTFFLFKNPSTN